MKAKTSELTDRALDYAAAMALGYSPRVKTWREFTDTLDPVEDADIIAFHRDRNTVRLSYKEPTSGGIFPCPAYSTDWSQGGPIIDRQDIDVLRDTDTEFVALLGRARKHPGRDVMSYFVMRGRTKLIAAMRCHVASELGDEVDIPEALLT